MTIARNQIVKKNLTDLLKHQVEDSLPCENDCAKLQSILKHWPESSTKPKAAIYFLVQVDRVASIAHSLQHLNKYFTRNFPCPIILFHESNWNKTHADIVRQSTNDSLFFQEVHLETPSFLKNTAPSVPPCAVNPEIGYRHMCRFNAKSVYEHPIIQGFEFLFRLDDDSLIQSSITYDVFEHMKINNLVYGYKDIQVDSEICVTGLWDAAGDYIQRNQISATFFKEWNYLDIFYNNFEISRLDLWLSKEYREYIEYIDCLGGIYFHRWGDAPIKTLALSMFVPEDKLHQYSDIMYIHGRHLLIG